MVVGAHTCTTQGMVCVEGTRKLGSLRKVHVTMLTVDVIRSDGDSSLVVITGDAEKLKVRGWVATLAKLEVEVQCRAEAPCWCVTWPS